jgi:hypothetical protein
MKKSKLAERQIALRFSKWKAERTGGVISEATFLAGSSFMRLDAVRGEEASSRTRAAQSGRRSKAEA